VTGRPRHRPRQLFADRGYGFDKYRRFLWKRGVKPVIARHGVPHGSGLGWVRWVVERTNPWIHGFRQLRIRWAIRDDVHEAFLKLACCVITYRRVQALCLLLLVVVGASARMTGWPRMNLAPLIRPPWNRSSRLAR
jgi:hypothetical protein